jgi:hypothetical protein
MELELLLAHPQKDENPKQHCSKDNTWMLTTSKCYNQNHEQ